jgi:hypothetical protein
VRLQESLFYLRRQLLETPVQIHGPTLIAVYPQHDLPSKLLDPELVRLVRDFRLDLPKAESIAVNRGLAFVKRGERIFSLQQPFNTVLTQVIVDNAVGFVIALPGLPPSILPGHVADSVLARAIDSYLEQAHGQRPPSASGT